MSAEAIYLENLRMIERVAAFVARRSRLNADETEEFKQVVCFRLLENDYAIIRKFEGRSSFSTYLTTCIAHLFHEWRVKEWGKWRPSAEAKRLGEKAVTLERLIVRDGYTFEEAVKVLTTPAGAQFSPSELEAIYLRLPPRNPRPVLVPDDSLPEAVAAESAADERVETRDSERAARRAATALDELITALDAEDRVILRMRFWDAMKVPDIARRLHLEQKKIYKRLDKLFLNMRQALEDAGVSKAEIARLLTRGDQEIHCILPAVGIGALGPSHQSGGEGARGGGGIP